MEGKFVIQQHETAQGTHFDLMLDQGEDLATFQFARRPDSLAEGESLPFRRLPNHRRAYLTYEGPVSGGRGIVRIVRDGIYVVTDGGEKGWTLSLEAPEGAVQARIDLPDGPEGTLRRL
jgi:hypothetical protein